MDPVQVRRIYAIYDRPRDYPNCVVVRGWTIHLLEDPQPDADCILVGAIEDARRVIVDIAGLNAKIVDINDPDPVIVEVWGVPIERPILVGNAEIKKRRGTGKMDGSVNASVDRPLEGHADISPCGLYRYHLWRRWADGPTALWVMLNPSTADADDDDPTIRKCVGFAKRWGCGRIEVVNLFAFRATDASELRTAADPVGPRNGHCILDALERSPRHTIVAWGSASKARGLVVGPALCFRRDLPGTVNVQCLGLTKGGQPRHPLMLAYTTPLVDWRRSQA